MSYLNKKFLLRRVMKPERGNFVYENNYLCLILELFHLHLGSPRNSTGTQFTGTNVAFLNQGFVVPVCSLRGT